jgi:hypothetical protein
LVVGIAFYAIAVFSTFGHALWENSRYGPIFGPIIMTLSISLAGLGTIVIGYFMVIFLGGSMSLRLSRFVAHLTHSKQIVETSKTKTGTSLKARLLDEAHWLYLPGLLFLSTAGLGWDVYNADASKAGFFQPVLHALDIFSRPPPGTSPIVFSGHLIPALILLTALSGLVPALVIAYFDRFKVTGVNAWPFPTGMLYSEVGVLAGLSAILTLVGLFYRSLWLNKAPLPYHFGFLTLLGFSLHFSLGMYIGVRNAEGKILAKIRGSESRRLIVLT